MVEKWNARSYMLVRNTRVFDFTSFDWFVCDPYIIVAVVLVFTREPLIIIFLYDDTQTRWMHARDYNRTERIIETLILHEWNFRVGAVPHKTQVRYYHQYSFKLDNRVFDVVPPNLLFSQAKIDSQHMALFRSSRKHDA